MNGKLIARLADNVLDAEDWDSWELEIHDGVIAAVKTIPATGGNGCYGLPDQLKVGKTLADIADWTHYDGTGSHPENYHDVKIKGEWDAFLSPEQLREELVRYLETLPPVARLYQEGIAGSDGG